MIQEEIQSPPNMEQFENWKASFIADKSDAVLAKDADNTWNVDPKSDELLSMRRFSIEEKGSQVLKDIDDIEIESVDALAPCYALSNTCKSSHTHNFPSEKRGVESAGDVASDNAKEKDNEMIELGGNIEERGISYENPSKKKRTNEKYTPSSCVSDVKSLLSTGILEGVPVTYINNQEKLHGIIGGTGYQCGCSSCEYSKVLCALEFENHAGATSNNQNNNIYFESGITIYMLAKNLGDRRIKLGSLDEVLEKEFQIQPSMEHFEKWKASFARNIDQKESVGDVNEALLNKLEIHIADHSVPRVLMPPALSNASKANCNQLKPKVTTKGASKKRNGSLHQLIFMENGLPDGSRLTYRKRGETVKTGYKLGNGIMCDCCNKEMKPSQFEAHAGFSQTRQPYRNIYTSNGISLHELSLSYCKVCCEICGTGGELLCCGGCTKSFHADCLGLQAIPRGEWYCDHCTDLSFVSGSASISSGAISSTKVRSRLILKAGTDQLLSCALCKDGSFLLNDFGAKTIIFCLQCEREYHIGCLKDHNVCDLKEVPMDCKWFCSAACESIYGTLQELVDDGESCVPDWLSSALKCSRRDCIHWQMLNGKNVRDYSLLSKTVAVFHEALDPIVEGGKDLISAMVHGEDAAGKMLGGVYCAIITAESIVVSAGIFRVFGEDVAELSLVATGEKYRGLGFFRALYSLLERILSFLEVKNVMVPATKDAESIWMEKFGFSKMTDERAYSANYPLILFETTSMLEKAIPPLNGKYTTPAIPT